MNPPPPPSPSTLEYLLRSNQFFRAYILKISRYAPDFITPSSAAIPYMYAGALWDERKFDIIGHLQWMVLDTPISLKVNLAFLKYFILIWAAAFKLAFTSFPFFKFGWCHFWSFSVQVKDKNSFLCVVKCSNCRSITITWQQRPHFPTAHSQKPFLGTL